MPPAELHIIGVDPGGTTGWGRVTVPRKSIFGDERGRILEWDAGQLYGPEEEQANELARIVRETQSLAYKVGPAVVVEHFELRTNVRGDQVLSPVRLAAMISFLRFLGRMGDSQIVYQTAQMAKTTVTDDRLRRWGYWVKGQDHARDAMRHALTALRRAKADPDLREAMWSEEAGRF